MREILFRGKTVLGKRWIYGNLGQHYHTKDWFIQYPNECETLKTELIIPETIGQFTGLTDKNGVKIFEHDVLVIDSNDIHARSEQFGINEAVEYSESFGCFISYGKNLCHSFLMADEWEYCFVIGNIHDTPELLEVVE